jgi:hypothetical protein
MPWLDPGIHGVKASRGLPELESRVGGANAVFLLGGVGSSKNRKQSSDVIGGD